MPSKFTAKHKHVKFRRTLLFAKGWKHPTVDVGILEEDVDKRHPVSGVRLGEIAIKNEFGSEQIPERSFIRAVMYSEKKYFNDLMRRQLAKVVAGKRTKIQALATVGLQMQVRVKTRIRDIWHPPNAEETIEKKGFNNPLIHTRLLHDSIKFKVHKDWAEDADVKKPKGWLMGSAQRTAARKATEKIQKERLAHKKHVRDAPKFENPF